MAKIVVITDLDGTLLDQTRYSYDASLPAIRKLQSAKIPLVLCSSKTWSEIEPLWRELGLTDPFIVENGGAIYFLSDYFSFAVDSTRSRGRFQLLHLGEEVSGLRRALWQAARATNTPIRSFGQMTLEEIAQATGLSLDAARAASEREYDEPFAVKTISHGKLFTVLRTKGFRITQGDRFYHISRGSDKGKASARLMELYRRVAPSIRSVGLGNSANDLPMLSAVDRPILVRKAGGTWDSTIAQNLPGIHKTIAVGPQGWKEAIDMILEETTL